MVGLHQWAHSTVLSALGIPKHFQQGHSPATLTAWQHKGREEGRRAGTSLFRAHHSTLTHRKSPGALQGPEYPPAGRGEDKQYFLNLIFKTSTQI